MVLADFILLRIEAKHTCVCFGSCGRNACLVDAGLPQMSRQSTRFRVETHQSRPKEGTVQELMHMVTGYYLKQGNQFL